MTPLRPKRRTIPVAVKRAVCERQGYICRRCKIVSVHYEQQCQIQPVLRTQFDHEPALILRRVNRAGTDYIPPQHSPEHIDALCSYCHHAKTHGTGATTAGTDIGKIKKERRRTRKPRPKRRWATRAMPKHADPWGKNRRKK